MIHHYCRSADRSVRFIALHQLNLRIWKIIRHLIAFMTLICVIEAIFSERLDCSLHCSIVEFQASCLSILLPYLLWGAYGNDPSIPLGPARLNICGPVCSIGRLQAASRLRCTAYLVLTRIAAGGRAPVAVGTFAR
jgi:hypothetical protein